MTLSWNPASGKASTPVQKPLFIELSNHGKIELEGTAQIIYNFFVSQVIKWRPQKTDYTRLDFCVLLFLAQCTNH